MQAPGEFDGLGVGQLPDPVLDPLGQVGQRRLDGGERVQQVLSHTGIPAPATDSPHQHR
ncbi:hypothetical protein GCM10009547_31790 [Sporichthya brevicatena]|uniref:Uncharacterized protein n=1 Tax=Sporichthya brevicatena TaxID=171442 RepID=A0ABN1H169_9ACTN